jgi:hypothetical protein
METLTIILSSGIGAAIGAFFSSYMKEKGKNLATKEDISLITKTVEDAKSDYRNAIEVLKTELEKHLAVSKVQLEYEVTAYERISEALGKLRANYYQIMPGYHGLDGGEKRKKFFEEFHKDLQELQILLDQKSPFFEKKIKDKAFEIMDAASERSTESNVNDYDEKKDFWAQEKGKRQRFFELHEEFYDLVRHRIEELKGLPSAHA